MKTLMINLLVFSFLSLGAQGRMEFIKEGNIVKSVEYYGQSDTVHIIGHFFDGKSHGRWTEYNPAGEVITQAYYWLGKKEGSWLRRIDEGNNMVELEYRNNYLIGSRKWALSDANFVAEK